MNAVVTQKIKTFMLNETQHIVHYTWFRSMLMGAGICYAVAEEKYHHLPLGLFMPSVYAGYQLFNNKDMVAGWVQSKAYGVPPADTSATIKATCARHAE